VCQKHSAKIKTHTRAQKSHGRAGELVVGDDGRAGEGVAGLAVALPHVDQPLDLGLLLVERFPVGFGD
jgi:hypothetical protein